MTKILGLHLPGADDGIPLSDIMRYHAGARPGAALPNIQGAVCLATRI